MSSGISRRDAIKGAVGLGVGAILGSSLPSMAVEWSHASSAAKLLRGGGVRFAHLTDTHVQPELRAGEGFAAALQSLKKLDPMPQFIITGGDHVMDTTEKAPDRCAVQWDLYQRVLKENNQLTVYPTIGNHDVAGWGAKELFTENMPGFGKEMAYDRLAIKTGAYGFDGPAGADDWRFINLDSITRRNNAYYGWLGDEQFKWLTEELLRVGTKRPICITSHLPIMSVAAFFDGKRLREENKFFDVPDSYVHRDMSAIMALLEPYNVRLLLSGHLHLVDKCEYRGKTFICDGAVSGNWWKGPHQNFPEGYGVIDIWPDGSFEHQYVTYGWVAEKT
ncbi:MAG: metallophosphoesterase [Anaerolineae bacterium]|nr:metallophosphoesterase [Phycisphaerae bacterium]